MFTYAIFCKVLQMLLVTTLLGYGFIGGFNNYIPKYNNVRARTLYI